jgi:hypothetical protein
LFDLRELHQLLSELVGIARIEGILILNCVVSSCRNMVKLLAISVLSSALETEFPPVAVDAGLMVVMLSSDANIKSAAL